MDRIVYWQPAQKQTCITQPPNEDSVLPADRAQRAAEK
jgi:hypothetical protein